jgi:hypothetical protein
VSPCSLTRRQGFQPRKRLSHNGTPVARNWQPLPPESNMRQIAAFVLPIALWLAFPSVVVAQSVAIETTVDDVSVADQRLLRELLLNTRHLTALGLLGTQRATRSDVKSHADQIAKDAQAWSTRISEVLGAGTAAAAAQPARSLWALEQAEPEDFDGALLTHLTSVDTALLASIEAGRGVGGLTPQVERLIEDLQPEFEAQAARRADLSID